MNKEKVQYYMNKYIEHNQEWIPETTFHTKYTKQEHAIKYAIEQIKRSPIASYVTSIILYGSCARREEKFDSDIDLFVTLNTRQIKNLSKLRKQCRQLKSDVTSDDLDLAEVDLKISFDDDWKTSNSLIYYFIRKEGIVLWEK